MDIWKVSFNIGEFAHNLCLKEWNMMRDVLLLELWRVLISPQVVWGEYNEGSCFYVLTFYLQYFLLIQNKIRFLMNFVLLL